MRFMYQDTPVELTERPLFAEIDYVERAAGRGLDDMSTALRTGALALISLRRAGFALGWDDLMNTMSPADLQQIAEEREAEGESDPTAAGSAPDAPA